MVRFLASSMVFLLSGCIFPVQQTVTYSIFGKVTKPNEDPVAGVKVVLVENVIFGQEVGTAFTNDEGEYRFDNLERRPYGITFTVKTLTTGFKPIVMNPQLNQYRFDMVMTPDFRFANE